MPAKKATTAKKPSRKAVTVKKKKAPTKKKKIVKKTIEPKYNPAEHDLVPKHEKLSDKEAKEVMERYHASLHELPKMSSQDPALQGIMVKQGDIIKITRKSYTAGETTFYRGVIDE